MRASRDGVGSSSGIWVQAPAVSKHQPWYQQDSSFPCTRPSESAAPRCGQRSSKTCGWPAASRHTASASPKRRRRIGFAASALERAIGNQWPGSPRSSPSTTRARAVAARGRTCSAPGATSVVATGPPLLLAGVDLVDQALVEKGGRRGLALAVAELVDELDV